VTELPDSTELRRDDVLFRYMLFARAEGMAAPYKLTQSGLAPPDPRLFADLRLDLAYAGDEALPALAAEIARRYGVPPARVLVTPGASGAMNVLAAALFRPGVRVAVETPSYEPLRCLPLRAGADVREVERTFERGWGLDVAAYERALAGARTGHVFVTSPHNPSGVRAEPETLRGLAALAERHGGALVSNEVYEEFVPPEQAVRAARLAPNAISIGSLTKGYGLGALRVGWIVLGEALEPLRREIEDAIYLDYVDLPTASLRAGALALRREAELREPIARVGRDGRPLFRRWLESQPRLRAIVPPHGLIAFAAVDGVADTLALGRYLAAREQVGVVPGEYFGRSGYLRLGFGAPPAELEEALTRLGRGLEAYAGA
jgi:aspartate/methionine/tyrosine aminotransferase